MARGEGGEMNAACSSIHRPRPSSVVLLLLLAAVAVGVLLGAPLTLHAQNSHIAQWNATTIKQAMEQGICKPILKFVCPPVQQIKVVCQLFPGIDLWGGLIIGTAEPSNPVIMTGYAARWSYWQNTFVRDSCVLAAP
jgi:hypothetical protein